ncbi:MAG TPA: PAS domain-containing protein [Candidatus Thermoplasmatota archaeon]
MQGLLQSYPVDTQSVFQWTPDEVVGKLNISRIFTKEDAQNIVPGLLKAAAATGRSQKDVTLVRKDGSQFKASFTLSPKLNEGKHVGYYGFTRPF